MQNHINNPKGKTKKGEGKYTMIHWTDEKDLQLIRWLQGKGREYVNSNQWIKIANQFRADLGYEVSVSTVTTKSRLLFPDLEPKRASNKSSNVVPASESNQDREMLELALKDAESMKARAQEDYVRAHDNLAAWNFHVSVLLEVLNKPAETSSPKAR